VKTGIFPKKLNLEKWTGGVSSPNILKVHFGRKENAADRRKSLGQQKPPGRGGKQVCRPRGEGKRKKG